MTALTAQPPPQQAPPQQQPPPEDYGADAAIIAAIIAALASLYTAEQVGRALAPRFLAIGVSRPALRAVTALVMHRPQTPLEGTGAASRYAVRVNLTRRAAFFLNAAKRVQQAIVAARSAGTPVRDAVAKALQQEATFLSQHMAASQKRTDAATAVDAAASKFGNLLGWKSVKDKRTTPGCRNADGKNFRADRPPIIEGAPAFPGATHLHCRCRAVRPYRGAPLLPSA